MKTALQFIIYCVLAASSNLLAAPADNLSSDVMQVAPRVQDLKFFPCSQCHDSLPVNSEPRQVYAHPGAFNHGGGRIWCLDCHSAEQRNQLVSGQSGPYTFDEAPQVCATCHQERYRDWQGGSHGKRVEDSQPQHVVYSCVHCHNPHDPSIKPRAPSPPPTVRQGLEPSASRADTWHPSWQRDNAENP